MPRVYDFDDPVYNAGMIHAAAVEFDAASADPPADDRTRYGGHREDFRPVDGYEALRCRVIPKGALRADPDKPGAAVVYKVMYADPIRLSLGHRLVWRDRAGVDHFLYVTAASVDAHEMRHHCSVMCSEQVV